MQPNQLHTPAQRNCKFVVEGRPDGEGYAKFNKNILVMRMLTMLCSES